MYGFVIIKMPKKISGKALVFDTDMQIAKLNSNLVQPTAELLEALVKKKFWHQNFASNLTKTLRQTSPKPFNCFFTHIVERGTTNAGR